MWTEWVSRSTRMISILAKYFLVFIFTEEDTDAFNAFIFNICIIYLIYRMLYIANYRKFSKYNSVPWTDPSILSARKTNENDVEQTNENSDNVFILREMCGNTFSRKGGQHVEIVIFSTLFISISWLRQRHSN